MAVNEDLSIETWKAAFKSYEGPKSKWNEYVTRSADNLHRNGFTKVAAFIVANCFHDLSHDG